MASEEMQQEELEVLSSIYEGDTAFKQLSNSTFQYKFGEDGDYRSFMVEISWPEQYPDVEPQVNLDVFYNKHIVPQVKEGIKTGILEQAADLIGMSMTFSLFEWVKDNVDTLIADQPEKAPVQAMTSGPSENTEDASGKREKEKKEHLTKSQKRRIFDRFGATTDRPRGWDWVDIIKHLSQTGGGQRDDS